MTKTIINFILLAIILVLSQAIVFNHLILFNCAIALVFIYLIVILPVSVTTNMLLTIGFFTGLCVDVFSDTAGLNALSCTILAFLRNPIYHLYAPRDEVAVGQRPSIKTMGSGGFIKYTLTMSFIYCALMFTFESVSLFSLSRLISRIIGSTIFTSIIIYAFDSLSLSRREKKL